MSFLNFSIWLRKDRNFQSEIAVDVFLGKQALATAVATGTIRLYPTFLKFIPFHTFRFISIDGENVYENIYSKAGQSSV